MKIEKKIQVLLSTYNGEKYLREQLDSILNQDCVDKKGVNLSLLVRDDGSFDGTVDILKEYEEKYPEQFNWYQGKNVGVIQSFFELMKEADEKVDYYSFADQDDVWLEEKLSAAITAIEGYEQEKPVLYCCRPKLVDAALNGLDSQIKRPPMRPSFGNALVENICTGCTAVMNKELYRMLIKEFPDFTVMHDWWFYLTASCFGYVCYDETPHILYRQHEGNVVGSNAGYWAEFKERVQRFKKNRRNISNQVGEFVRIFQEKSLADEKAQEWMELAQKLLLARKDRSVRREISKEERIYRQRKNDDRIFRMILRSGSY